LADLRKTTILVVEDDPDTLELLRSIFSACGARVLLASTVQHARGYLQTLRPDLVVSDLALPHEDGVAFVRWLRGQPAPALARLPVVAVTAFYEEYPPNRAHDFAAYFRKPIPIEDFCLTVEALIRKTRTPPDEPTARVGEREP
jgi:DNA-binding response OmpR family regulator